MLYFKNKHFYILDEVAEDWEAWGEWVAESEAVSVRKRICKNKGPNANCRGNATQRRFREVKKETEPEIVIEGDHDAILEF